MVFTKNQSKLLINMERKRAISIDLRANCNDLYCKPEVVTQLEMAPYLSSFQVVLQAQLDVFNVSKKR